MLCYESWGDARQGGAFKGVGKASVGCVLLSMPKRPNALDALHVLTTSGHLVWQASRLQWLVDRPPFAWRHLLHITQAHVVSGARLSSVTETLMSETWEKVAHRWAVELSRSGESEAYATNSG